MARRLDRVDRADASGRGCRADHQRRPDDRAAVAVHRAAPPVTRVAASVHRAAADGAAGPASRRWPFGRPLTSSQRTGSVSTVRLSALRRCAGCGTAGARSGFSARHLANRSTDRRRAPGDDGATVYRRLLCRHPERPSRGGRTASRAARARGARARLREPLDVDPDSVRSVDVLPCVAHCLVCRDDRRCRLRR